MKNISLIDASSPVSLCKLNDHIGLNASATARIFQLQSQRPSAAFCQQRTDGQGVLLLAVYRLSLRSTVSLRSYSCEQRHRFGEHTRKTMNSALHRSASSPVLLCVEVPGKKLCRLRFLCQFHRFLKYFCDQCSCRRFANPANMCRCAPMGAKCTDAGFQSSEHFWPQYPGQCVCDFPVDCLNKGFMSAKCPLLRI